MRRRPERRLRVSGSAVLFLFNEAAERVGGCRVAAGLVAAEPGRGRGGGRRGDCRRSRALVRRRACSPELGRPDLGARRARGSAVRALRAERPKGADLSSSASSGPSLRYSGRLGPVLAAEGIHSQPVLGGLWSPKTGKFACVKFRLRKKKCVTVCAGELLSPQHLRSRVE